MVLQVLSVAVALLCQDICVSDTLSSVQARLLWVNSNLSWLQEPKCRRPLLICHHNCSELSADSSKGCGFGVFFPPEWWNKISLCPPTGQFQTAALEAFSMVELPYLGEKLSIFLVLPSHKRIPLSQIESHLSAKTITLWANSLKRTKMDIFLPR